VSDPAPSADTPFSTGDTPINRLAAAIRRISSMMVGQPLSDEALAQAAEELTVTANALTAAAETSKRPREQPNRSGHPADFFPTSPMIGYANPIAPPVDVWSDVGEDGQREIRGRVTFDYQYEGPPTCVHGGVIAALFDELLGSANIIANKAGMTGTLTVRYRRPTPLLAPLDVVARFTGTERRKIFTWGGLYHDGELTAEAEGIFIEVQPGQMLDIVTTNAKDSASPVLDPGFIRLIEGNARQPR
jgi:acyl-coenzyme A thioesterase PaaI-like protein